jgi:hypothetical protein
VLPRRWRVERSFDWAARFRHLARNYEGLVLTMQQFYFLAFVILTLGKRRFSHRQFITSSSQQQGFRRAPVRFGLRVVTWVA